VRATTKKVQSKANNLPHLSRGNITAGGGLKVGGKNGKRGGVLKSYSDGRKEERTVQGCKKILGRCSPN